jgi:hypothetical protein
MSSFMVEVGTHISDLFVKFTLAKGHKTNLMLPDNSSSMTAVQAEKGEIEFIIS